MWYALLSVTVITKKNRPGVRNGSFSIPCMEVLFYLVTGLDNGLCILVLRIIFE